MDSRKEEILQQIRVTVRDIDPHAQVVLFGSQARNEARADSDWDLLILIPHAVDRAYEQKFRHSLMQVEMQYGIAVSAFVYCESVWHTRHKITPFYQIVNKEGILL